jgi:adenylate cyclase
MFRMTKSRRRFINGALIAVGIGLLLCLFSHLNLLHGLHLKSSDFLYGTADPSIDIITDSPIAIVAIDDKSLEQLGRFSSWPRSNHSQLVDILANEGARTIVFDILFSEASPDDDMFAAAIGKAGNVILPFVSNIEAARTAGMDDFNNSDLFIRPLKQLEGVALATGHATMTPDDDGIVRRLPLLIPSDNEYEPALALTAVAKYLRRPQIIESPVMDNAITLAGRSIPLDNNYRMLINYPAYQMSSHNFPTVSYSDILDGSIDPSIFHDKIVLIGVTAIGFGDIFWTPTEQIKSGVELHANAIYTILSGDFLTPTVLYQTDISIFLLAILCGVVVLRWRVLWSTLSLLFLIFIYVLTAFYFFDQGIVIDMLYPPMAIASVFVGMNLYNIASERHEKGEMVKIFGKYVSPSVATKILQANNEDSLKLGGEECAVSVLFADIRNFTGLSENIDSPELVNVINRYLSAIIKSVLRHDGMINKFGGDSIMAIWNVPIKHPEHALAATKAGIEAQQLIKELSETGVNLPDIQFGIGINTGNVIAGNMGSFDRLEYSVIGDSVNIAARLADIAAGGKVLVGADTFELIKEHVTFKQLAPLSLKGKREQYQAYEILEIQDRV